METKKMETRKQGPKKEPKRHIEGQKSGTKKRIHKKKGHK